MPQKKKDGKISKPLPWRSQFSGSSMELENLVFFIHLPDDPVINPVLEALHYLRTAYKVGTAIVNSNLKRRKLRLRETK